MSLSGDQFNEIMESLRSDILSKRALEKRGAPRVGLRSRGVIVSFEHQRLTGAPIGVWIRDLSVTGIGLMHSRPLEPGAQFVAQFLRATKPPLSVLYVVTHTKPISKTIFSIGAKMERVMDLISPQPSEQAAPRAERRPA
jgi:hypothetical protein